LDKRYHEVLQSGRGCRSTAPGGYSEIVSFNYNFTLLKIPKFGYG